MMHDERIKYMLEKHEWVGIDVRQHFVWIRGGVGRQNSVDEKSAHGFMDMSLNYFLGIVYIGVFCLQVRHA